MDCVRCGKEICREELTYCRKCESPHHQHCWETHNQQCAFHGCAQTDLILKQVYEFAKKRNYNCARHVLAENMTYMTTVDPYDVFEDLRQEEQDYFQTREETRQSKEEASLGIWQTLMFVGFLVFVIFVVCKWGF